jgi:hypothetical protein
MVRKLGAAVVVAGLAGGAVMAATTPAHATPVPNYNCTYPYVCLYNKVMDLTLKYQDVTSGYQGFSNTGIYYGLNTRNDDVAYIRYTNGKVACMPSGSPMAIYDLRQVGVPNGIKISSADTCDPATVVLKPTTPPS